MYTASVGYGTGFTNGIDPVMPYLYVVLQGTMSRSQAAGIAH